MWYKRRSNEIEQILTVLSQDSNFNRISVVITKSGHSGSNLNHVQKRHFSFQANTDQSQSDKDKHDDFKGKLVPTVFKWHAESGQPHPKNVWIAGSFNDWQLVAMHGAKVPFSSLLVE